MNIDISNAHCGPRIQFPDHAWLRVVLTNQNCLRRLYNYVRADWPRYTVRCAVSRVQSGVRAMIGRSPNDDSSLWRVVLNDTEEESVRTRMKYSNYYYKRARARVQRHKGVVRDEILECAKHY